MKKILLTVMIILVSYSMAFAAVIDYRISDNDGNVLDINSDGSVPVTLKNSTVDGQVIIDTNNTEALLVRKDTDAGDVLTVDTSTPGVTVNTNLTLPDNAWAGLGSAKGRIEFDDTTTDEVNILTANVGIGTQTPDTLLTLTNNNFISAKDAAGTSYVNMFKVNASDEIEIGGTLSIGTGLEYAEDIGQATLVDLPVSATPDAATEESYTMKVDGTNVLTVFGLADSSGGLTDAGTITSGISVIVQSGIQSLAADGTINNLSSYVRVQGSGAARTLSVDPAIENGKYSGQLIIIEGTNDTNTLTINDNVNTQNPSAAAIVLGANDTVEYIWNGADWICRNTSNN